MKKALLFLLIPLSSFISVNDCGVYRFDNKILIDSAGLEVFKEKAQSSSIDELVGKSRPDRKALGKNRTADESQKVTITAFVIEEGSETDQDYHLVLKSTTTKKTLIAEIPDPSCKKLKGFPGLQASYKKARDFFEKEIDSSPGSVKPISKPIKVIITGVPFYDKIAHGNGHSENGIEIHPVLKIVKAR